MDDVVRGTGCRLLQREGSVGVWVGGVGSLAVDYWRGNRWAQARHVVCGVQREGYLQWVHHEQLGGYLWGWLVGVGVC